MTTKRSKLFTTPLRRFSYNYLKTSAYPIGVEWLQQSKDLGFFIASPEKALADMIITRNEDILDINTFVKVLEEDYRIDDSALRSLDINMLIRISRAYKKKILNLLVETISEINNAK